MMTCGFPYSTVIVANLLLSLLSGRQTNSISKSFLGNYLILCMFAMLFSV